MNDQRNYGIDLLRSVSMLMVCILHVLFQGGVLDRLSNGSLRHAIFSIFPVICMCAVNCFALISGYTATNRPVQFSRLANMWFQAFFYSFVLSVILSLSGVGAPLGIKDLIKLALPVAFDQFWYFSAYFLLFFAMPLLNKALFPLDRPTAKKVFVILLFLFCLISFMDDCFVTNSGLSPIWIIFLYCLGVLAKKIEVFRRVKTPLLLLLLVCSSALCWLLYIRGYDPIIQNTSPFILLNALLLVVLFSRIRTKGTLLRRITPLVFGIYLYQLNPVLWNAVLKDRFVFISDQAFFPGLVSVMVFAGAIFLSGLAVEFLRSRLAVLLRIPQLSEKLVCFLRRLLDRLSIVGG